MGKTLIIVRGLPGSGKTTFSEMLTKRMQDCVHLESDQYFMKDGEYKFDINKLHQAHKTCQQNVKRYMESNQDTIIVSNTSTKESEVDVYYELAKYYGYEVFCIIMENRHGGINTHNVPQETLERMKYNLKNNQIL